MTKSSILTRVLFVVIMLSSIQSFASDGMSPTTPSLINEKIEINLTQTVTQPANKNNQWHSAAVTAITHATTIEKTYKATNTDFSHETIPL